MTANLVPRVCGVCAEVTLIQEQHGMQSGEAKECVIPGCKITLLVDPTRTVLMPTPLIHSLLHLCCCLFSHALHFRTLLPQHLSATTYQVS